MATTVGTNVPKTTAGAKRAALADDLKNSLYRYHQLDGLQNGSYTDGVQFNPLADQTEKGLKKHIDDVTKFIAKQKNVDFRPSPSLDPGRGEYRAEMAKKSAAIVKASAEMMLKEATNLIVDPSLRTLVQKALKEIPAEFYTAPSSSTGKYHPADEINDGGLVLHTCRVVTMAQHLGDFYGITQKERDILTAGLILHDSCKGGLPWEQYAKDHGDVAAGFMAGLKGGDTPEAKKAAELAANHMAQWSQTADGKRTPRPPQDKLNQIVSYADYLAAQDNIYVCPNGYKPTYLDEMPAVSAKDSAPVPDHHKWYTRGNKVTPLADAGYTPKVDSDDIFTQIKANIQDAKKSIQLEMFGFGQEELATLLADKAKEGLPVQVVLDPINEEYEKEKEKCVEIMREGGVEVLFYPVQKADPAQKKNFDQINHVKMLILDGEEAIIGGMNWGSHSPANHDVDVHIEGPVVDKMEALFNKDYGVSGGKNPLPIEKTEAHPEGDSLVSIKTGSHDPKERQIKAALHDAIRRAQESIHAELFFLTDWSILNALVEKKEQNPKMDIKVLLNPSMIGETKFNEKAAAQLSKAGIEVKWFKPDPETGSKLHSKLGIFDGEEVMLGSANWTGNGLSWNREANVSIIDGDVGAYYTKMFKSDFRKGVKDPVYLEENGSGAT
jgi:hypothetical protein